VQFFLTVQQNTATFIFW